MWITTMDIVTSVNQIMINSMIGETCFLNNLKMNLLNSKFIFNKRIFFTKITVQQKIFLTGC